MDLSIIVPVYNVEAYIRPCIESILKQGLDENRYEVIIVNDGTEDRSMEMIADIIDQHTNITVINQENQGLSIARNNGMERATGEYIMFLDSDDLFIDNSIPYLLNKAISSKTDLVVADFIGMNDNEIATFDIAHFHQGNGTFQEKTGKDLLSQPLYSGFSCVWHTLYKRDFLKKNNLYFIPHIYFEDTPFTYQCYAKANQCLRVDWTFIIYRNGNRSITTCLYNQKKVLDYCVVIAKIWELSQDKSLSYPINQKLQNDAYSFFSGLLFMLSKYTTITHGEKLEVLRHLQAIAPDLSFQNGIKQRLVSFLFHNALPVFMILSSIYFKHLYNTTKK
ncbi:MAG: glycosyltransferase [Prevotella sp.]|nr:glycosyltransferase [Prevotella sp.]